MWLVLFLLLVTSQQWTVIIVDININVVSCMMGSWKAFVVSFKKLLCDLSCFLLVSLSAKRHAYVLVGHRLLLMLFVCVLRQSRGTTCVQVHRAMDGRRQARALHLHASASACAPVRGPSHNALADQSGFQSLDKRIV